MLEPRDRQLLFEALRPPDGFRFDEGVGTTFSLDLLALLMAPLASLGSSSRARKAPALASIRSRCSRAYADTPIT